MFQNLEFEVQGGWIDSVSFLSPLWNMYTFSVITHCSIRNPTPSIIIFVLNHLEHILFIKKTIGLLLTTCISLIAIHEINTDTYYQLAMCKHYACFSNTIYTMYSMLQQPATKPWFIAGESSYWTILSETIGDDSWPHVALVTAPVSIPSYTTS